MLFLSPSRWRRTLLLVGGLALVGGVAIASFNGLLRSDHDDAIIVPPTTAAADEDRRAIVIDYPETMRVGEEVTLSVKDTPGWVAVPGQFLWSIRYGYSGDGGFDEGKSSIKTARPSFRAEKPGEIRVSLLMVVQKQISENFDLVPSSLVEQEFTIQVLQ